VHDPFVIARPVRLNPGYALASSAIPFCFRCSRSATGITATAGLRLNTPLAPALRLGADRLLIVGPVSTTRRPRKRRGSLPRGEARYNSLAYLGGKVLNALLLDHVDYDVDRLRLVNAILDTGIRLYGPDFLPRMNETIEALRRHALQGGQEASTCGPPATSGVIATDASTQHHPPTGLRRQLSHAVIRYAVHGVVAGGGLLSLRLCFDRCYAGSSDTSSAALTRKAHADDLAAFFAEGLTQPRGASSRTCFRARAPQWTTIIPARRGWSGRPSQRSATPRGIPACGAKISAAIALFAW